jgi:crossover junction endodeoxyribonuclease RuvC
MDIIFIGIDGGMQGAIGAIYPYDDYRANVISMPTYQVMKGKKRKTLYDKAMIKEIFMCFKQSGSVIHVMLESAQPYPEQGSVSNFTTGHSFGFMEGLLTGLEIPYETVHPKTWQKEFFAGKGIKPKHLSYDVACTMFPTLEFRTPRGRVLDGHSDAILIAEYCRRKHGINNNNQTRLGQPNGKLGDGQVSTSI